MRHEANTVEVLRAGDHQDEMKEEWSPANNEDTKQHSQSDGSFHAGSLTDRVVPRQSSDFLHVSTSQEEHMDVQGDHEEQHGKKHSDETNDHISGFVIKNEDNATARAKGPDACNNEP